MVVEELKGTARLITPPIGPLNRGASTVGAFIREQRVQAQVSLRQLSDLAGVSNPYLSQIERGLRKPSAEILQQIAKGLRISAEQLYLQAGILESRDGDASTEAAIMGDPQLSERQKHVMIEIYESFCRENDGGSARTGTTSPSTTTGTTAPDATPSPKRKTPTKNRR